MDPIQCEEISSTSDLLPRRPAALKRVHRGITLVVPTPNDENLEETQLTYFRNLALYISSLINRNIVAYAIHPEYDMMHLTFGMFPSVDVKFRENANGVTKMRCSVLRDTISLPTLSVLTASNMLFDAFLETHNYHVDKFQPKTSVLAAGYPKREFSCTDMIVETPNANLRQILETWMPVISTIPRIIHCGRLAEHDVQALFWEVHANWFLNVQGVECSTAPLDFAISLYRTFPVVHLYDSLLPIALFFRWVKGWIVSKEGCTSCRELIFQPRGLLLTKGVFKTFLNYQHTLYRNETAIGVLNTEGQKAHVYFTKHGAIVFQVEPEGEFLNIPGLPLSDDEVTSSARHISFPVEELDEPYELLNDEDYGDVTEYAIVLDNYEPRR